MVARRQKVFTTEDVVALLGLGAEDTWRVTKFIKSREYGIEPAMIVGSGHGSRRLYDIENVCEIGLALRLLEAGLRPRVVGQVLKEATEYSALAPRLKVEKELAHLRLAVLFAPRPGKPLDASRIRYVNFVNGFREVEDVIGTIEEGLKAKGLPDVDLLVNYDVLLVAVGLMFQGIRERLETMQKESAKAES